MLGIQEYRLIHSDEELRYENLTEGFQLITAIAARDNAGVAVGGVRVLLSPYAKKSLSSITCESSRILKATFSGKPESTIFITYSPTNVADEKEVEEFYNELDVATKSVLAHSFFAVISMQDWGKTSLHIPTTNQQTEIVNYSIIFLWKMISLSPVPDTKRRNQSCGRIY